MGVQVRGFALIDHALDNTISSGHRYPSVVVCMEFPLQEFMDVCRYCLQTASAVCTFDTVQSAADTAEQYHLA